MNGTIINNRTPFACLRTNKISGNGEKLTRIGNSASEESRTPPPSLQPPRRKSRGHRRGDTGGGMVVQRRTVSDPIGHT